MTEMIEHRLMSLCLSTAPPLPLLSTLVPIYQYRHYIQKHKLIAVSPKYLHNVKEELELLGISHLFYKLTLNVCILRFQNLSLIVSKYAEDIKIS